LAFETANLLKDHGQQAAIISMHTVKPLDIELLTGLCQKFPLIVTLEEHSLIGGLGSFVAEWMSDQGIVSTRLLRFGTGDRFPNHIGSQKYTRELFDLIPQKIAEKILEKLHYAHKSCYSC
jgi:transketolase